MKEYLALLIKFFCIIVFSGYILLAQEVKQRDAKTPEGKKIFLENKCQSCHSVQTAQIVRKTEDTESTELKPPDLSGVGLEHKAEWLMRYLQKKEKLDGEKHPKRFRGNDEELGTLTKWLETLKTDKKSIKK